MKCVDASCDVPPARGRIRRCVGSGQRRVWLLNAVLVTVTVALFVGVVRHLPAYPAPFSLPWPLLAALFAATEIFVVHVQFRRDAHSFSLGEVPLVLGLFFVSPAHFVLAQLVGAAAALVLHRRQSPIKLTFNLAHFCLEASLAALLFSVVPTDSHPVGPVAWVAAFLATTAGVVVAVSLMFTAMSLSAGRAQFAPMPQTLRLGITVALTNTSLGLIAVMMLWFSPASTLLMIVPVVTLFLAYRAYVHERDQHERLNFLYEATRTVTTAAEVEGAVSALLAQAREMFRAEVAELTLFPPAPGEPPLRTVLAPGVHDVMAPVHQGARQGQSGRVPLDGPVLLRAPLSSEDAERYLEGRVLKDAMLAPLAADGTQFGLLAVANRSGDVSTFDPEDLRLLETLASQASVGLENGRLEKSLQQLTALKEQLRHQVHHDSLTGLPNRTLLNERVEHALLARRQEGTGIAVLLVDLDDFKAVNDTLGHAAGDALLVEVADRIRANVRPADTAARLGGDEFAVLLRDPVSVEGALVVAERIVEALSRPAVLEGRATLVQGSVGLALAVGDEDGDELLRNADAAMYEAKQTGKNQYRVYEAGMHGHALDRLALRRDLQRALAEEQFRIWYQPIVDMSSGTVLGVEALLRWEHPVRGLLPAEAFIDAAEETGLIVPLGAWVLDEAARQVAEWQRASDGRKLFVCVNLSPRQLAHAALVEQVRRVLAVSGLPPSSLTLEITERVLIAQPERVSGVLCELKELGVRLALDDFGIEYSSLNYLRDFPVDVIKVAKPFVDDLLRDDVRTPVAHAILQLAAVLGFAAVAEGVERAEQAALLQEMGCPVAQGHYYAPALPPADAQALLGDALPVRVRPVVSATQRARG